MPVTGCRVAIYSNHTNHKSNCITAGMEGAGMNRILTIAVTASLLSAPVTAAPSPAALEQENKA